MYDFGCQLWKSKWCTWKQSIELRTFYSISEQQNKLQHVYVCCVYFEFIQNNYLKHYRSFSILIAVINSNKKCCDPFWTDNIRVISIVSINKISCWECSQRMNWYKHENDNQWHYDCRMRLTSAKISCNSPSLGQQLRDRTIVPISLKMKRNEIKRAPWKSLLFINEWIH